MKYAEKMKYASKLTNAEWHWICGKIYGFDIKPSTGLFGEPVSWATCDCQYIGYPQLTMEELRSVDVIKPDIHISEELFFDDYDVVVDPQIDVTIVVGKANPQYTKIYRQFMLNKFGEQYKEDCFNHDITE
nr:hypothetical protein [Limosilactobacillus mucosae]